MTMVFSNTVYDRFQSLSAHERGRVESIASGIRHENENMVLSLVMRFLSDYPELDNESLASLVVERIDENEAVD